MKLLKKKRDRQDQEGGEGQDELHDNFGDDEFDTMTDDSEAISTSANPDRIRFCSDIHRLSHRKLKIFAATSGITLNYALEKIIECQCQ